MDAMETKSNNIIQLEKDEDILVFNICDEKGNDTGETIEFDLADIELPLKYQEIIEKDKENRRVLKDKLLIIERQQDHKGKKLLSSNQEAEIKAWNEFYKKEIEIFNMFLGERGVEKLLNGRKVTWTSLEKISEIIEKQMLPKLTINAENIKKKIMKKYGKAEKEDDVIE